MKSDNTQLKGTKSKTPVAPVPETDLKTLSIIEVEKN